MLKDITLGQYFPGESYIHNMDARIKIVLAVVFMIVIFCINSICGYLALVLFTIFMIGISKIPFRYMLKAIKPVLFFVVFTAILNILFTRNGEVLWNAGFIVVTKDGVANAIYMIFRITFLVMGTSLLTYTTSPIELTDGMERLLSPFSKIGLPSHELAMMMSIALRFIPTILEETDKITKAQTARGADFESGNVFNRAKALIPLLVPLFISAFRRADELAMAMECRCYHGGKNRTKMNEPKLGVRDGVAVIVMLLFVAVVIFTNILRW